MREILFKAKRLRDGMWVQGSYFTSANHQYIIYPGGEPFEVDPNTLCEYISLDDKNGKKIFEHDIVSMKTKLYPPEESENSEHLYEIVFSEGRFVCQDYENILLYIPKTEWIKERREFKVVGNIFDNPELFDKLYFI